MRYVRQVREHLYLLEERDAGFGRDHRSRIVGMRLGRTRSRTASDVYFMWFVCCNLKVCFPCVIRILQILIFVIIRESILNGFKKDFSTFKNCFIVF